MARSLRDRLIFELIQTRSQLVDCVSPIPTEELDYSPAADGKSYRALLAEIGAMEAESSAFLRTGVVPPWEVCEAEVRGSTTAELLESLTRIQEGMLEYLSSVDDVALSQTVEIPEDWVWFFGDRDLEREELVRWVARHEYYHLGQMIIYRWIQGHNPYEVGSM